MEEILLRISPDGTTTAIYDDRLADFFATGKSTTERASHVEPGPDGGWIADMKPICQKLGVPPVILGPCPLRSQALQLERGWLEAMLFT